MAKEQSAGAVIFRIENKEPCYLLLHYPTSKRTKKEYWDFPKGHLEKGETQQQAAAREVEEETGLKDIFFVLGFAERIHYYFLVEGKTIFKTVLFFLARTKKKEVKLSFEHKGFIWLPFDKAMAKLKFANARRVLRNAHRFLKERQKKGF
jgi:bis(5'-nucleosidyl)-tetraphosphatase